MRMFDQHLHSWNSCDCDTPPEDNVRSAIESGLSGLTFTDHFDTHPDEWDACIYDDDKIARELAELHDRFGDDIFIGKGIETCYQPARMDFILEFLSAHSFDAILLSVHWASGKPIHRKEFFDGIDCSTFLRLYLEAVRDATSHLVQMKRTGHQPFHILGHLDLARRYAIRFFDRAGPLDEPVLIDEILKNCLDADIIPEINTSALRQGLSDPMPGLEIVNRYAELGGTMMAFGSDAHLAKSVGAGADLAIDLMQKAGITHLAVFEKGQLRPEALDG